MGAGFLPSLQCCDREGGGGLCYATIEVAEEKVVVGDKLFELDCPAAMSAIRAQTPVWCLESCEVFISFFFSSY